MALDSASLQADLASALGGAIVEPLHSGAFRVLLPTGRVAHDWTLVAVEPTHGGAWAISDGGHAHELLAEDFDDLVDLLRCAGAPFEPQGRQLVATTSEAGLLPTLMSYCHHLAAMPVVWQVEQCRGQSEARAPSAISELAEHMRRQIILHLPSPAHGQLLRLNAIVAGRGERVRAPLAVKRTADTVRPDLVSSFIDMTAPAATIRAAKQRTSFLYTVLSDQVIPKYVVVLGAEADIGRARALYDTEGINVVDVADPDLLVQDAVDVVQNLVG